MPCDTSKRRIREPHKGGLHRSMGMDDGKNKPDKRIAAAAKGKGKVARQAIAAMTLKKLRKAKKRS